MRKVTKKRATNQLFAIKGLTDPEAPVAVVAPAGMPVAAIMDRLLARYAGLVGAEPQLVPIAGKTLDFDVALTRPEARSRLCGTALVTAASGAIVLRRERADRIDVITPRDICRMVAAYSLEVRSHSPRARAFSGGFLSLVNSEARESEAFTGSYLRIDGATGSVAREGR